MSDPGNVTIITALIAAFAVITAAFINSRGVKDAAMITRDGTTSKKQNKKNSRPDLTETQKLNEKNTKIIFLSFIGTAVLAATVSIIALIYLLRVPVVVTGNTEPTKTCIPSAQVGQISLID